MLWPPCRFKLSRPCGPGVTDPLLLGANGAFPRAFLSEAMEIKLSQKLTTNLVMTPQLQQAIRLLQLSRMELIDEVGRELEANPVLADDDVDPSPRGEREPLMPQPSRGDSEGGVDAMGDRYDRTRDLTARDQEKKTNELDWEQFLENRSQQQPTYATKGGYEELPPIEQTLTRATSLHDHLLWQIQMSDFTDAERRFAEFIIGNLDERGYVDLSGTVREDGTKEADLKVEEIARAAELDPEDALEVLSLIQHFDPNGVGSRDLRECLRVQAEIQGFDELELAIIDRHMHNLEKHNFQAIAKDLKVPLEEVYEAAKAIQTLESRPARNFTDADDRMIAITPDVYVVKDSDKFVVLDNDRGVQRLYINESLTKRLLQDPNAKEFINEKLRNAHWLIRAIEQRRKTIIRVTEAIVERQREFFEKGVAYLKPMILRDIAEAVNMHESTISRVTTSKYVHTPQGLFELKYFFNSSIRRKEEEDIASESVKQAIKKIIDEEDKQNPLSDQAIVELLEKKEGIQIARRTVAKYREMLGILASSKRKKLFLR
jgi:RNA polymerase sigma-54 factor